MENQKFIKIYDVENVYDGHYIYHMMKDILHLDCKKETQYKGEGIYVRKDQYFIALKFVTMELLRREPENEVKWIDYYQRDRSYHDFCYGSLKLNEEYINPERIPFILETVSKLWNSSNDLEGKAPISVHFKENGYLYLEGNIHYDDKEKFWHDLRYLGLIETFLKRRKYCQDIMEENRNIISTYANLYYVPTIDGTLEEVINFKQDSEKQKAKEKKL